MRPRVALCTSAARPRSRSRFDATRSTIVLERPVRYCFETCASWMASGAVATSEGELVREGQRTGAAHRVVVGCTEQHAQLALWLAETGPAHVDGAAERQDDRPQFRSVRDEIQHRVAGGAARVADACRVTLDVEQRRASRFAEMHDGLAFVAKKCADAVEEMLRVAVADERRRHRQARCVLLAVFAFGWKSVAALRVVARRAPRRT